MHSSSQRAGWHRYLEMAWQHLYIQATLILLAFIVIYICSQLLATHISIRTAIRALTYNQPDDR
jgi:hypothetical protein